MKMSDKQKIKDLHYEIERLKFDNAELSHRLKKSNAWAVFFGTASAVLLWYVVVFAMAYMN